MREIILDTETTGLSFELGDRIIEVGCVELYNHVPTGKTLQFFCNVQKKISEEASKIHGITNEFLSSHPTFKESANNLINFVKDDTLVIHNAAFDIGFINNELKIIGLPELKNKIIDTVSLARKKLNTRIVPPNAPNSGLLRRVLNRETFLTLSSLEAPLYPVSILFSSIIFF